MKFKSFIFILIISLKTVFAFGKTLIVTHPETLWDPHSVAGQATRELLSNQVFKKKIVLFSYKTNFKTGKPNSFTFSKSGLKFLPLFSENGEHKLRLTEPEVYVAGGHWEACLSNTIEYLIDNSSSSLNLKIHVMMKAVFNVDGELSNPDHERGIYNYVRTLDVILERDPNAFLKEQILPIGKSFMRSRMKSLPKALLTKDYLTMDFILDGQTIATFGQGPKKISIILERDLVLL